MNRSRSVESEAERAVEIVEIHQAEFDAIWHHHMAVELTLVHRGSGCRFVGERIEEFGDGDLVLIGAGVPHFWRSNPGGAPWRAEATVVHFDPRSLGFGSDGARDLRGIAQLIEAARFGVAFDEPDLVMTPFARLQESEGWRKAAALTEILGILSEQAPDSRRLLSRAAFPKPGQPDPHAPQLNRALQIIFGRLSGSVTLDAAAEAAGMSRFAFCQFFQRSMGCGFAEFLNEARIAHVCEKLRSDHRDIGSVASAAGFGTLSNFHRVFKRRLGKTPGAYRREALGQR